MFSPILFQIKICIIIQQYYNDPFVVDYFYFNIKSTHYDSHQQLSYSL